MISPAAKWAKSMTGLPEMTGGPHRYRAPDFDTLADSPIVVGNPAVYEFTVDGKKHYLVNEGEGGVFDGARAAKDLEAIVREHRRMWGSLPYDKYLFLNLLTEAGGGLEHKNSTVLMGSRWLTRTRRAYVAWLELASHEFFHVWNVKRLRPVELGPFDYENEVHTKSLWIAEGFTDYYGDLAGAPRRPGDARRVPRLAVGQDRGAADDARAARCSRWSWRRSTRGSSTTGPTRTRSTRRSATTPRARWSAFLLDARIRKLTNGAQEPRRRDARRLRAATPAPRATPPTSSAQVAEQVAGTSLKPFWDAAVTGTQELDYTEALDVFGLRFRSVAVPADRGRAWLGASTRNDAGRLVVTQVRRERPAAEAGLNVDDEILAIGDYPRARRPSGQPAGAVSARRSRDAAGGAPRAAAAPGSDLRRRAAARAGGSRCIPRPRTGSRARGRSGCRPARREPARRAPTARRAATAACCWCGCWCSRACTCSRNTSAEAEPRYHMLFGRALIIILLIVVVFWILGGMLRDARSRGRRRR